MKRILGGLLSMVAVSSYASSVFYVILAGGSGERLWPLSRQTKPKQLLSLHCQKTFLEQSLDRIKPIMQNDDQVWVVTSEQHQERINNLLNNTINHLLIEPKARNTAAAMFYACLSIKKISPDATVVFLPADPFIPESDMQLFQASIKVITEFCGRNDSIALMGIKPTCAATGYGYIEYHDENETLYKVDRFHEKPDTKTAEQYLEKDNMLWNTGIFASKLSFLIDQFKIHAPEIYKKTNGFIDGQNSYEEIENTSVDYAVIEKTEKTWVLPGSFSWCDVGNVHVFLGLKHGAHGDNQPNVISVESSNNLVDVPDTLVALVGVKDLCVVQAGNALLITQKDEVEKVKAVVSELKQTRRLDYL